MPSGLSQMRRSGGSLDVLILSIIFAAVVAWPLSLGVPTGRDWVRYWHPLLEYLNITGAYWDMLWQGGGGVLVYADPSSFAFDPVYLVLSRFLHYPANILVYLPAVWFIALLAFLLFLRDLGVDFPGRIASSIAYGFGGLAISIGLVQFIPIYFHCAIFAYSFLRFVRAGGWIRFLTACLSAYYFMYSAVPNIALIAVTWSLWALRGANRKKLILVMLGAVPMLVFPYGALMESIIAGNTPLRVNWTDWGMHPARLAAFFVPEFMQRSPMSVWWNHKAGMQGSVESYFFSLSLPAVALCGLLIIPKGETRRFAILGLALFLAAFTSRLPESILNIVGSIPLFWVRYPEKYLILAVPILLACSAVSMSMATDTSRRRSLFAMIGIIIVIISITAVLIPRFSAYLKALMPDARNMLLLQLLLMAFAAIAYSYRGRGHIVARGLTVLSVIPWLLVPYTDARSVVGPFWLVKQERSGFYDVHKKRLAGHTLHFHHQAYLDYCQVVYSEVYTTKCAEYDASFYFRLMNYSPYLLTSFGHFLHLQTSPHEEVVNLKPRYYVITKEARPREFCQDMVNNNPSIIACDLVTDPSYKGAFDLLEFTHKNMFSVSADTTPRRLIINVDAQYEQIRVPFFPPAGASVLLNGQSVKYGIDSFGTFVDVKKGKSVIEIVHTYWSLKVLAVIAITMMLLVIAAFRNRRVIAFIRDVEPH